MFGMFHFLPRTTRKGDRCRPFLFKNVYSSLDKAVIAETQGRCWFILVLVQQHIPDIYGRKAPRKVWLYYWSDRQGLTDLIILKTENYSPLLIVSISTIFFCIISSKPFRNLSLSFCVICWKVIRSLSIKIWSDRTSNCSVEEKYEQ